MLLNKKWYFFYILFIYLATQIFLTSVKNKNTLVAGRSLQAYYSFSKEISLIISKTLYNNHVNHGGSILLASSNNVLKYYYSS